MEKFKLNPVLWVCFLMLAILIIGLRFISSAVGATLVTAGQRFLR